MGSPQIHKIERFSLFSRKERKRAKNTKQEIDLSLRSLRDWRALRENEFAAHSSNVCGIISFAGALGASRNTNIHRFHRYRFGSRLRMRVVRDDGAIAHAHDPVA